MTIQDAIYETQKAIDEIFSHKDIVVTTKDESAPITTFGKCPRCGAEVKKGKFGIYCTGKCDITFGTIRKKELTDKQWIALLEGKRILLKKLLSKDGKEYEMTFKIKGTERYTYTDEKGNRFDKYRIVYDEKFPEKKGKK